MHNNFDEFDNVKQRALKYICLCKRTEFEVRKKLTELKFSNILIEKVIDYLKELDYINDIDYIKSFISQNKRFMKYSIYEIEYKLKNKGIDRKLYSDYIDELKSSEYNNLVVKKIISKKSKSLDDLKSYLYRRGFDINE